VRFADPWWLTAFAALPVWWWFARRGSKPSVVYSDVSLLLAPTVRSWRLRSVWLPTALWTLGVCAAVVALARPQLPDAAETTKTRGRGLSIVVDVSGSMGKTLSVVQGAATSRLDAAKQIIEALVRRIDEYHPNDELGLTVFAAEPRVLSPATTERPFVGRKLSEAAIDLRDNRTEIGAGLALGIDVVRNWPEGEAAVLLFTDGAQRVEEGIGPLAGARIAEALGVPVIVVHFADDPQEAEDLKTLAKVVEIARGRLIHWAGAPPETLLAALPPPPVAQTPAVVWRDAFPEVVAAAIALLLLAEVLRRTVYATVPEATVL
jgi:Mg-chelatase subunit ChlD